MEKKQYIIPTTNVMTVETQNLFAASSFNTTNLGDDQTVEMGSGVYDDTFGSRYYDDWEWED